MKTDGMTNDELWQAILTGHEPALDRKRRRHSHIPGTPRCRNCFVPLGGPAWPILRAMGTARGRKNPNFCNVCDRMLYEHPGGAVIELSLLFADVRGSTAIAESMSPAEFSRLMHRFYDLGNKVLFETDAYVDKVVGDEVIGLYFPMMGPHHPAKAVEAARELLLATGHDRPEGPWLPVGAGVHTSSAWVGAVKTGDVPDLTALGDGVNVAARIASSAQAGEILVSETAYATLAQDLGPLERRTLSLKGRDLPVEVRVMRVAPEGRQQP